MCLIGVNVSEWRTQMNSPLWSKINYDIACSQWIGQEYIQLQVIEQSKALAKRTHIAIQFRLAILSSIFFFMFMVEKYIAHTLGRRKRTKGGPGNFVMSS